MRSKKEPFSDPDELDFCAFRCVRQGNYIVFRRSLLHDSGMTADDPLKASFPPVIDADTRVLVLGSLPGEVSLARQQYYAHPTNQFWRLISGVAGCDLASLDYEARLSALLRARIGLWDVIRTARRHGSLDGNIRDHSPNALPDLLRGLPALKLIAFNGNTSSAIGRKGLGELTGVEMLSLPSSSAAYTLAFAEKQAQWLQLRNYL